MNGLAHQRRPDTLMLAAGLDNCVDQECMSAAVPCDIDKFNKHHVSVSVNPRKAVLVQA